MVSEFTSIREAYIPMATEVWYRPAAPISNQAETMESLDWDAAIDLEPALPSGTMIVTLQYAGDATPAPTKGLWD